MRGTLHQRRANGRLELRRNRTLKTVRFHLGAPFDANSNIEHENLITQLERDGVLDADAIARAEQLVSKKSCKASAAILALELVEPKALIVALREQLRRRLIACFGWPEGEYAFHPDDLAPAQLKENSARPGHQ